LMPFLSFDDQGIPVTGRQFLGWQGYFFASSYLAFHYRYFPRFSKRFDSSVYLHFGKDVLIKNNSFNTSQMKICMEQHLYLLQCSNLHPK
jgi:hypothetical protein